MGKHTKEELALIKKDNEDIFKLLLKKTGMSYKRLIEIAKREFVVDNLDELTPAEKSQFKHVVL